MRFQFPLKNTRFFLSLPSYLKTPILLSILVTAVMAFLVSSAYFSLPPQVPLFYSLARSTQHLTHKAWLFLLPSLSVTINIVHLLIIQSSKQDKLLIRLFAWTSVVIQVILGLSLIRILWIIL